MKPLILDDRQFSRLCAKIGVVASGNSSNSRRVEPRVPIQVAIVSGKVVGISSPSTLRDVSREGASLINPRPIPVDTGLVFFLGGEDEPIRVISKVTHTKRFADGTALVSVQFTGFVDPKGRPGAVPPPESPQGDVYARSA